MQITKLSCRFVPHELDQLIIQKNKAIHDIFFDNSHTIQKDKQG